MTSKSSFLTSLWENRKRRMGYILVLVLIEFFHYPIFTLMGIEAARYSSAIEYGVSDTRVFTTLNSLLGVNMGSMIFAILFGILAGLQGFSYLNNRKKVDIYHSIPVSKKQRFWTICLNGFLWYAIIHVTAVLFAALIASCYKCMTGVFFGWMMLGLFLDMISFLSSFCVTILAVMITGNFIISVLATGSLILYELALRALLEGYCAFFFSHYSAQKKPLYSIDYVLTSPIIGWASYVEKLSWAGATEVVKNGIIGTALSYTDVSVGELIRIIISIAVIIGIAFVVYMKRPSEAAGKSIAFAKLKQPIKGLLLVVISMGAGLIFYAIVGENKLQFEILGLIIGLLIGHILIEILFEFDLRAPLQKLPMTGVAAGIVTLILCFFVFDVSGYDSYIPKEEEIEYCGVYLGGMQHGDFINFDNSMHWYCDEEEETLANMKFTDAALICELARRGLDESIEKREVRYGCLEYHLKNGKVVRRKSFVNLRNDKDLLDKIFASEEYVNGAYQINYPEFEQKIDDMKWYACDAFVAREPDAIRTNIREVFETYRAEFNKRSYETAKDDFPIGLLVFQWTADEYDYGKRTFGWEYPIYDSFVQTLAIIGENGMQISPIEFNVEDIERIAIYGPDMNRDAMTDENINSYDYEYEEWYYSSREELADIVSYVYCGALVNWIADFDYSYYSADISLKNGRYIYGTFHRNELPKVLLEKLNN